MNDYINFIVPQFSITDINFQRVPTVDTSNPFEWQEVPSNDQSVVVIHFRDPKRHDFPALMKKIGGAFMSRPNTLVVPGGEMVQALEVVCTPIIRQLVPAE
jgi:phosphoribulokinase